MPMHSRTRADNRTNTVVPLSPTTMGQKSSPPQPPFCLIGADAEHVGPHRFEQKFAHSARRRLDGDTAITEGIVTFYGRNASLAARGAAVA
jgi:hypothetical protein